MPVVYGWLSDPSRPNLLGLLVGQVCVQVQVDHAAAHVLVGDHLLQQGPLACVLRGPCQVQAQLQGSAVESGWEQLKVIDFFDLREHSTNSISGYPSPRLSCEGQAGVHTRCG